VLDAGVGCERVEAGVAVGVWVVGARVRLGRVRAAAGGQPDGAGNARIAASDAVKVSAQGHRAGSRSVAWPERFTITAASATSRVRRVRFGACQPF